MSSIVMDVSAMFVATITCAHTPPMPSTEPPPPLAIPAQGWAKSRCRFVRGEPSPSVVAAGVSPVPLQIRQGWAQPRCRRSRGEPSPRSRRGGRAGGPVQSVRALRMPRGGGSKILD
jgi:hypothetical protein